MARGSRWWIWVLGVLVVAVPIGRAAQERLAHGYPESDDATIALLAQDSLSHDPPLVGMISTAGQDLDDPEVHHPGPSELYLLAPFVRYGPGVEPGATVGAALIGLAALAGMVVALRAVGGDRLAAGGLVAAALVLWGVGSDPAASVWNPYVVILPFACLLALVAACASGRPRFLPATLGVASAVAQTHLAYAPIAALLALWALVAVGWRARRSPRDLTRPLALAALVTFVLWLPPLVQQIVGHPGNLAQLARAATHGSGATVGRAGLGELGRVLGPPVLGLRPRDALVRVLPDLGVGPLVLLAVPVVVAASAVVLARRRGRADLAGVAATVLVALAAGALTAVRMPLSGGVLYQYYALWMWPLAAVGWLLLGGVGTALAADRVPALDRVRRAPGRPALVAVGLVALLGIGLLPRPGPWAPWVAYRRIAHEVVPDTVDAIPRGRYLVRFRGATAYLSTGSAVVAGLDQAGSEVFVDPGAPTPVFPWREFRRHDADERIDAEVWVVSGPDPADLPAGARRVASTPTVTPAEARREHRRAARLEAALASGRVRRGPRRVPAGATGTSVTRAGDDPVAALRSGLLADLASRGLVHVDGVDLQDLVTDARMRGLVAERSVRVYLVDRQRS